MRNDWLLFFHVLAAFVLVGGVIAVVLVSLAALRETEHGLLLRRVALTTNLAVVLPAFVAAYVFGGALSDREFPHDEPGWLGASVGLTDLVGVVGVLATTLLQWWVVRRARAGTLAGWHAQIASYLPILVLGVLFAIMFLMSGKPS